MLGPPRVIGFLGPPGSGKTQLALRVLADLARDPGCAWVAAHDPNGDLPRELHDGAKVPLVVAPSVDRLILRINTQRWRGAPPTIHVRESESPTLLTHRLMTRQEKLSPADRERRPGVLYIDEAGTWSEANPHRRGKLLGKLLARRRHWGFWLLWGAQFPRQVHYSLISQSNYIVCFNMEDESDLSRLKQGGVSDVARTMVRELVPFRPLAISMMGGECGPITLPNQIDRKGKPQLLLPPAR